MFVWESLCLSFISEEELWQTILRMINVLSLIKCVYRVFLVASNKQTGLCVCVCYIITYVNVQLILAIHGNDVP